MMWRPTVILLPLFIIGYADGKGNTICELNEPCLRTANSDKPTPNQHGERQVPSSQDAGLDNDRHSQEITNPDLHSGNVKDIGEDSRKNSNIEEDKQKMFSDEILRHKRSSPTLLRIFKTLFIKPSSTTTADNVATRTKLLISRQNSITTDYINNGTISDFQELLGQMNETLKKLDEKLSHYDLQENKDRGTITIKIPISLDYTLRRRFKREISENTHNATTKLDSDTLTEHIELNGNRTFVYNVDSVTKETNATNLTKHSSKRTNDVILKIYSALKNVQNQLSAIQIIKDSVSSDERYKVGYIVASLDNLELTLEKLFTRIHTRNRVDAHKFLGNVELSKQIVSNLIEYLRMYQLSTTNKS